MSAIKSMLTFLALLGLAFAVVLPATAQSLPATAQSGAPAREPGRAGDVLFNAMQDEMARSMSGLRIPGMPAPYFLSYRIVDAETATIEARYSALVNTEQERERRFYVECRVGDPTLDNSYYIGSWRDLFNRRRDLVEEDDYGALRHQIWLLTDSAYKNALENLAGKQAYLQSHPPQEQVADFSPAEPLVEIGEPARLQIDIAAREGDVRAAAQALKQFPSLQDWKVTCRAEADTKHYLNSEGSRDLTGDVREVVEVEATAQAADGQRLTSFMRHIVAGGDAADRDALVKEASDMAAELQAMVAAPMLEEYAGPVLFKGFAAAQLVSQLFAEQLSPTRTPITSGDWMRQSLPQPKLTGKLNRRVFPEFVSVTDDPSREEWNGQNLAGHRVVDDEGVACETVKLVDRGRLVSLPMARAPIKKIARSNGHAYTFENQWTAPVITNLIVETAQPNKDLVNELRRMCREFGTEYGLIVTRLEDPGIAMTYRWTPPEDDTPPLLSAPVGIYRVYEKDGRVEPVRGLVFDEVSVRTLRDLSALGAQATAYNLEQPFASPGMSYPASIVTPDILVEEMELKAGAVHEPLPVAGNPMFVK